jgi:hypothetical protein
MMQELIAVILSPARIIECLQVKITLLRNDRALKLSPGCQGNLPEKILLKRSAGEQYDFVVFQ